MSGHEPCGDGGASGVDCDEAIKGVPAWNVAHTLGEQRIVELFGPTTQALVDGTGHWMAAMLEDAGVSKQWAVEIGAMVEQHTAGTLYQAAPKPFPDGFARLLARVHLPLERG